MSQPLSDVLPHPGSRRLDPLGTHLQLVRDTTGRDALLESWDGEIVAYALGAQPSSAVCAAVLARSSGALRTALNGSRKVALSAAGAVRTTTIDGLTATVIPVDVGGGTGRLWLLGPKMTEIDPALTSLIDVLAALATRLSQVEAVDTAAIVSGEQPMPSAFAACSTFLLVAASDMAPGVAVEKLRQAGRRAGSPLIMHVGVHQGVDVALIVCRQETAAAGVAELIGAWGAPEGTRSVIAPCGGRPLDELFAEARRALTVAPSGCSLTSKLRSRLFLQTVCQAIGHLEVAEGDPIAPLITGQPEFAHTLLAWLDAHGDSAAVATALHCHVNTVRYRIRRAVEVLGGDLCDPAFRLEVHLRLMAAMHGRSRAVPDELRARAEAAPT